MLMILFGFLFGSLVRGLIGGAQFWFGTDNACICVIGFIIPGLMAIRFERQGIVLTLGSLATSAAVVRLVLVLIGLEIVI